MEKTIGNRKNKIRTIKQKIIDFYFCHQSTNLSKIDILYSSPRRIDLKISGKIE
ncbi:MAG: hypothetical protein WBA93_00195 [Microcoleaceae cyanobacterium]